MLHEELLWQGQAAVSAVDADDTGLAPATKRAVYAPARIVRAGLLALALFGLLGCRASPEGGAAQGEPSEPTLVAGDASFAESNDPLGMAAELERLASPNAALPKRAALMGFLRRAEAVADGEGASARGVAMRSRLARVFERSYRRDRLDEDAARAVSHYQAAARRRAGGRSAEGAPDGTLARLSEDVCEDIFRAAYLEGERRGDAAHAAAALDEARAVSPCAARVDRALRYLAAYAPVPRARTDVPTVPVAVRDAATTADGLRGGANVRGLDAWPGRDTTRVVVTLDRPMRYRVVDEPPSRGDGPKTVVELDGVGVGAFARDDRFAGIVTSLRVSETTTGTRVALALDGVGYRRVFHLLEPFRVIVDIAREPPRVRAERGPRPVRRVVLDPGHGGSDPGAIGATGLREKDVTLDLAHRIAPVLAGEGIEVALTRDDDRFVALEERTARANGFNADLFVSIHCNAAENTARHGIETYVLDTTSDAIAARVAARENATSPGAAAELGGILASLRFADHASRSTRLAELFQKATRASAVQFDASVRDGGVKTAGFYVLVGARMPSVLFEANYLSNPEDEARLRSAEYRSRLADGVVNAIRAYREGR